MCVENSCLLQEELSRGVRGRGGEAGEWEGEEEVLRVISAKRKREREAADNDLKREGPQRVLPDRSGGLVKKEGVGERLSQQQKRGGEKERRYEPGRRENEVPRDGLELKRLPEVQEMGVVEREKFVKGDLNQRRLFSESRGKQRPVDQGRPAGEQNMVMGQLKNQLTSQIKTGKDGKGDSLRPINKDGKGDSLRPISKDGKGDSLRPISRDGRPIHLPGEDNRGQRVRRGNRRSPVSDEEGFPLLQSVTVDLGNFKPDAYLSGQHLEPGGDEMKRFQFNQRRSEATPFDRDLKDVRNPR